MEGTQFPVCMRCKAIRQTEKAVLVEYHNEEHWLPFSQILSLEGLEEDMPCYVSIQIPSWLAAEKGIIAELQGDFL